jgi:hypothetical protein
LRADLAERELKCMVCCALGVQLCSGD